MAYRQIGLDRILEQAAPPGTGSVTVGTNVVGFYPFSAVLGVGDTCAYFIEGIDSNGALTGHWERGIGTMTSATVFTRSKVIVSTSSNNLVNFTMSVRIGVAPMSDTVGLDLRPGGRIGGMPGSPTSDLPNTGGGTLYYTPYLHDHIVLWDGFGLRDFRFTELSYNIATFPAGYTYDLFAIVNAAGAVTLTHLAWSNATGRATNLAWLNGFLCLSTDPTRRYLGSWYCSAVGTVYDHQWGASSQVGGKRCIWNMYNRLSKTAIVQDTTGLYTDASASWRIARAAVSPGNSVEICLGRSEDAIVATVGIGVSLPSGMTYWSSVGVGGNPVGSIGISSNGSSGGCVGSSVGAFSGLPGVGYSAINMLELAPSGAVSPGYANPTLVVQGMF